MSHRLSPRALASVSFSRMPPAPDGLSRKCRVASRPHARSLRSPPRSSGLPDDEPRPQTRIHVTATRCGDVHMTAHKNRTKAHHFMARLTIDVTPDLRARIKVAAFRRGITVAAMLRNLLSRAFPPQPRDTA